MTNRSSYMREYYLKRQAEIKKQRKLRYDNDPEYKQQLIDRKKRDRQVKRMKRIQENTYRASKIPVGRKMRLPSPFGDGESIVVKMFTINEFCEFTAVTRSQMIHWLNLQRIPPPNYRNSRGWKLYTEWEAKALRQLIYTEKKRLGRNGYSFKMSNDLSKQMFDLIDNHFIQGIPKNLKQQLNETDGDTDV